MIENFVNRLILVKQDCLACLFLGETTNYIVNVFVCNVGLNTEPCHAVHMILIHDGLEIICDELRLAEASFC